MALEHGNGWCGCMDKQNELQASFEETDEKVFNDFALVLARNHDEAVLKFLFISV